MLSIRAISSAGYYLDLATEDYYLGGGEPPGWWWGSDLATGTVERAALNALLAGVHPDGTLLVARGRGWHQPGWDLTFSAPKSVSVVWAMAPPAVRRAIQEAHAQAVHLALRYLERAAARARRGHGGRRYESVHLTAAIFEHGTSRAQDPQLHSHALVLNVGRRADGTCGAIWSRGFYLHKRSAGALYRAELGRLLREQLRVDLAAEGVGFRVVGVPDSILEHFSKRRAAVLAELRRTGRVGAVAAEMAALETRERKEAVPREQLFERWQSEGERLQFGAREAADLLARSVARPKAAIDVAATLRELTMHEAVFFRRDLVKVVAERLQATGVGGAEVLRLARQLLADAQVVRLQKVGGFRAYSTREQLDLEAEVLRFQVDARGSVSHVVGKDIVLDVVARHPSLRADQLAAVKALTEEAGQLRMLTGLAGSGKTFVQRLCREACEAAGLQVVGVALSARAAAELQDGSGIQSRTLASFFVAEQRAQRVDQRTVIVLDEASMVGTRQMAALFRTAAKAGAKVVLVGDPRQLEAIEAGAPFDQLLQREKAAELTEITRQREPWMRNVVRDLAEGDVDRGLDSLAAEGRLVASENPAAAEEALVEDWFRDRSGEALVLASTRAEVGSLNRRIQAERFRQGELGHAVHSEQMPFRVGDRIVFTRNDRFLGVHNGDFGAVDAVQLGKRGQLLRVLVGERAVVVDPQRYSDLQLGYAVTTHKAQGATVEVAASLVGEAVDRRQLYVQASRSRGATRLYNGGRAEDLRRKCRLQREKLVATPLVRR